MTIDELVVSLVLDATGFSKGQADAAASLDKTRESAVKSAKGIEASALAASDGVEKLGRKFLGLYALLTGGRELKAFVSDMTTADAALGRTARNIDMSAKSLSTWQGVAEAAGGSAQGITGSLASLSGAMQEAALTGNNRLAPVMRALGVNLADAGGHARNAGDVLIDLNRRYNSMHLDPATFTSLMHRIGIDDGTITLLEKTTTEFDKLRAEQEKYAATSADTDAAQRRQSGWRELLITSSSLGRTILTALTPAIVEAMKAIQDWADKNQDWIKTGIVDAVKSFSEWLKKIDWKEVRTGISDFVKKVDGIASALLDTIKSVDPSSDLFKAFEAFGAMLAGSVLLRITGISSALTALGGVALPGWLSSLLLNPAVLGTVAVGAVLASGDPKKALLDGGHPDVQPQDNDLGLPGVGDRRSDTSDAQAKAGGFLSWFKKAIGWGDRLHDDAKTRDGIADTAKATKGILDVLKAQKDGADATAAGVPNGTNGGSFPHSSTGATPGTEGGAPGGEGGTRSWRNNNPGNLKYGPFAQRLGATGKDAAGFAIFPSYDAGRRAQEALWFDSPGYKDKTLAQAVAKWSPPGENDTAGIVKQYAAAVGVDPNTPLSQFTAEQRAKLLDAQQAREGWRAGTRSGPGSIGSGDIIGKAEGMVGLREGQAAQALGHIMHAGEWCADFVNGMIEKNGGKGSGNAMARSFMHWGKAVGLGDVKRGDVAVLNGGGHVGFFTGERTADGRMGVIAGNTRDGRGGHDVEHYFVDPRSVYGARRGEDAQVAKAAVAEATKHAAQAAAPAAVKAVVIHGKPIPHQPTFNDLAHHIVKAIQRARKLTHHGDKPVAVTYVDRNGVAPSGNPLADLHKWRFDYAMKHPHAAALDRMTRMAAAGSYSHTVNNNSTDTKIHGGVHVHTQATDAKGIAADLGKYLFQGSDARQANRGLA